MAELDYQDNDVRFIDPCNYDTVEEVDAARFALEEIDISISMQLKEAAYEWYTNGIEIDGHWRNRAKYSLSRIKLLKQKLSHRRGQLSREEKHQNSEASFIQCAFEILPRELFHQIRLMAEDRRNSPTPQHGEGG